ncbi:holdfast anchoring protein HfaA [Brevundimonas sp. SORGH_AS_0993]|uniref:holdfast anchoring protein HfaA n=1 Tax=Brevundimonas sp. SORGH_AS_0993 TaxID=3041794 RepID=UPI00278443D9|nr:holdfast anchoring protein HfaA [Brevundimonas sp. SORGH_AS_0993]MDQ1155303.1 holdfast attachment protein HfaA [Brevundimonas sp. SORGH_AS_0993]
MSATRLIPPATIASAVGLAVVAAVALPAVAQSTGSGGAARFQQGYGGARSAAANATTGSTRDANGNRLIVNGIIQAGASSYSSQSNGVASAYSGAGSTRSHGTIIGGATAIGNQLNVVVQGSRNTVIVNSNQTNTGPINAGTALNGSINLP